MATRMLIDARHPEETRVAVLKGNRIDEFDFESAEHKQIKGNIYLAKVTRVEPSLQAAFVDFGGNRHGFLAFSEIHPDYYQIPKEDRDALLAEEQAHADEEAALRAREDDDDVVDDSDDDQDDDAPGVEEIDTSEKDDVATIEDGQVDGDTDNEASDSEDEEEGESEENNGNRTRRGRNRRGRGRRQGGSRSKEMDDLRARRQALRRRYKIQDVIHRRQVLLVQVVKEERGNKGAALTTYLSLAGRYCVLMPNSSHGGGISRKISNGSDRKRLKQIVSSLELPRSMGLIVRTAGLQRTKTEIKRDFDYLARLWDEIRSRTMTSTAPAVIHSDSDLIKRAIRDIYNREIEEVVVEGEEGYKAAKQFMKLLMPSHARRVKAYADPVPLFQRYGAEDQLSAMYDPVVQLRSGGYLVINPTEALVSIDINSGRSTKEHGIEQTALSTNLEAAQEIARQLRLRDMAGLVVIDFIDMEHNSNVRKVERCMKDALKNDRARIQVGRISGFGLMEMSRQRLRTGVLEATTRSCPHCDGTGLVRTASSAGLSALRVIEDEAAKGKGTIISLYASTEAAVYLLNAKRADLAEIERRYGVSVEVIPEGEDEGAKMRVASSGPRPSSTPKFDPIIDDDEEEDSSDARDYVEDEDGDDKPKKRRRRGGRRRKKRQPDIDEQQDHNDNSSEDEADSEEDSEPDNEIASEDDAEDKPKKRRRRGGRRRKKRDDQESPESFEDTDDTVSSEVSEEVFSEAGDVPADEPKRLNSDVTVTAAKPEEAPSYTPMAETEEEEAPKPKRRPRRKKTETPAEAELDTKETGAVKVEEETPKPKRRTRRKKTDSEQTSVAGQEGSEVSSETTEEAPPKPKRRTRRKKAEPAADGNEALADKHAADMATEEQIVTSSEAVNNESPPVPESPTGPAPATDSAAEETGNTENESDSPSIEVEGGDTSGPPRRGWWQRTFGN
ncbi:ribonuclease E/G [Altericroceibacterium spongiae]|uniref:Ribonuclease E n=1 Tax=Altericroceibacterium spongiae TaxID=2320269 RepID=A0A420ERK3_9SPHN|nr:ribonuclease E/G [Altericroceibacterium spongiae]RKF23253.1 ribonuclease E/G [Altericroceibacterium spongiae]